MNISHIGIFAGDLHDGTGLSDATPVDGQLSQPVFEQLDDYDLLTIGITLMIALTIPGCI